MRFKAIPPAPDELDMLEAAWRSVGLVPDDERSCCRRVADRLAGVDLDEARRWLALMRALELVERGPSGYTRTQTWPEPDVLGHRFLTGVFGVEELLEAASEQPLDEQRAFDALNPHVPAWERHRAPNMWRDRWRKRATHLLEWGVLLGVFRPTETGYRPAPNVIDGAGA